jgi:hypothetical protein
MHRPFFILQKSKRRVKMKYSIFMDTATKNVIYTVQTGEYKPNEILTIPIRIDNKPHTQAENIELMFLFSLNGFDCFFSGIPCLRDYKQLIRKGEIKKIVFPEDKELYELRKMEIIREALTFSKDTICNKIVELANKYKQKNYLVMVDSLQENREHYLHLKCLDEKIPCKNSYYSHFLISEDNELILIGYFIANEKNEFIVTHQTQTNY